MALGQQNDAFIENFIEVFLGIVFLCVFTKKKCYAFLATLLVEVIINRTPSCIESN